MALLTEVRRAPGTAEGSQWVHTEVARSRGVTGLRTTQQPEWGDGSAPEEDFAGSDS